MIPSEIDAFSIIEDLKRWGWNINKIQQACGFSRGYLSQVARGKIHLMTYQRAARLFNFWQSERALFEERERKNGKRT
jgi:hypothetical protein